MKKYMIVRKRQTRYLGDPAKEKTPAVTTPTFEIVLDGFLTPEEAIEAKNKNSNSSDYIVTSYYE